MANETNMEEYARLKDRALFFLDRHLRSIEVQESNGVQMAQAGMSYAERRKAIARAEEDKEETRQEREALEWIRGIVVQHKLGS